MVQPGSVNLDRELEIACGVRGCCWNVGKSPDERTGPIGSELADSKDPLEVVRNVMSIQLAPVHRRLVVPVHVLTDIERE